MIFIAPITRCHVGLSHTAPLLGTHSQIQTSMCSPAHNIWVIHNSLSLNCHQTCFPVYLCALGWHPNQGLELLPLKQIKTEGLLFLHSWKPVVAVLWIGPTKILIYPDLGYPSRQQPPRYELFFNVIYPSGIKRHSL